MYSQFIKELIDLPDVLIQKVRKEEERWIFELSLPEQCPLCPVCLKRTIKMTGKKKQWMHGYAQRIGIFWIELPVERRRCGTCCKLSFYPRIKCLLFCKFLRNVPFPFSETVC